MPRFLGSVRARTAIGATVVVAVALVTAGFLVINVVRSGLGDTATSKAEAKAREVATQVAARDDPRGAGGLDTEDPVQIVDLDGKITAHSPGAEELTTPLSDGNRPKPTPSPTDQDGDRDDDDNADDDSDDGDDDRPDRLQQPRGQVSSAVGHDTITLMVDGQGRPVGAASNARAGTSGSGSDADDRTRTEFSVASVQASTQDGDPVTVYASASLAAQQRAVNDAGRAMAAGLPLVLAVVALVAWFVVSRALRPVEGIRSELATITASDDLSRRVPEPTGRDEINALARTTNETLAALEESAARQRQFVADASHELRSPIASLRTQLEVAAAHPELLDIDDVVNDVVRLQELAGDLLLLARLDAGEQPRVQSVSLAELVGTEVARLQNSLPVEHRVVNDTSVRVNRSQVARVLTNLVDNAVRHAHSQVIVTVATGTITVDDDGPGVPPDQVEKIFERFVRLDDARTRDDGGAGLGLTIAREVMRQHGGDLVMLDAPTGGARFEARFGSSVVSEHAGSASSS